MILVVDDDDDIRESIQCLLEDEQCRVLTASDGFDAMDILIRETERPCIVLLDLMMPRMTGWQVFETMQRDRLLAQVPVCVMTAVPDRAPSGASCVLAKPVSADALLDVIHRFC